MSFAPSDKPVLAVAVIVENGGHGGRVAAPIARQIFDQYFATDRPNLTTLAKRS